MVDFISHETNHFVIRFIQTDLNNKRLKSELEYFFASCLPVWVWSPSWTYTECKRKTNPKAI